MSILNEMGSTLGTGIAGGVAGGITNAIFGGLQTKRQKELNESAARINYLYGEKAAENAYRRELEMYNISKKDNSPEARKQAMIDAGLSPGLMMSGAGAAIGGAGAIGGGKMGATGGATAGIAPTALEIMETGLNIQRTKLENKLLAAQANKTEAEANETDEKGKGTWYENIITDHLIRLAEDQPDKDGTIRNTYKHERYKTYAELSGEKHYKVIENVTQAKQAIANEAKTRGDNALAMAMTALTTKEIENFGAAFANAVRTNDIAEQNAITNRLTLKLKEKIAEADIQKTGAETKAINLGSGEEINWKTIADIITNLLSMFGPKINIGGTLRKR